MHGSADKVAVHRKRNCDGLAITMPIWSPREIEIIADLLLTLMRRGIRSLQRVAILW